MDTSGEFDTGPLTWVKGEIDLALARTIDALRAATATDEAATAESASRQAAFQQAQAQLHQVQGALTIVGLDGLARFVDAGEQMLQGLANGSLPLTADAIRWCHELPGRIGGYLEALLAGQPDQPLRLFPAYRDTLALLGTAASPADLFFPYLSPLPPARAQAPAPLAPEAVAIRLKAARLGFQRGLLKWLKGEERGLSEMRNSLAVVESTQQTPEARAGWWVALALLDALLAGGLPQDAQLKKLCGRIDAQIAHLQDGKTPDGDRLKREALYYIAIATATPELVEQVRATYRLAALIPAETTTETAADSDQNRTRTNHLRTLREQLEKTKDEWNHLAEQPGGSLIPFQEHARQLVESSQVLGQMDITRLTVGVQAIANMLVANGSNRVDEPVALEVATSLLLIDNALDQQGVLGVDFAHQVDIMAGRLTALLRGETPAAVQAMALPQLDEISRQAQERLLMNQVAREILGNLALVEQKLDLFFREPASHAGNLDSLQAPLKQSEGALLMLGEQRAVEVLRANRQKIAGFADGSLAHDPQLFEAVASQLSALGFFVEQLRHGPADLDLLLPPEPPAVEPATEALPAPAEIAADLSTPAEPVCALPPLATEAPPLTETSVTPTAETAEATEAATETAQTTTAPVIDDEMLEIFIEEAYEVLATIEQHLPLLTQRPTDQELQTVIRRAFHTLKGSGRMVGLNDLGEAAWSVEQVMNLWLKRDLAMDATLHDMLHQAYRLFDGWVHRLATRDTVPTATSAEVRNLHDLCAHLLRDEATAPATTAAAPEPPAAPIPQPPDDTIILGTLSLSPLVYDIYLQEAREHLAVLEAQLPTLQDTPPSAEFLRAIHTLAGVSGTVGVQAINQLGKALEYALERFAQAGWMVDATQHALQSQAVATLRGMLDALAERRLPAPAETLTEQLNQLTPGEPAESPPAALVTDLTEPAEPAEPAEPVEIAEEPVIPTGGTAPAPLQAAPATAPEEPDTDEQPFSDRRRKLRIHDDIDHQLLPIFLEEGGDLLREVGVELRAWRNQPDDTATGQRLQRILHTFKGSARMAGAMRLGELVHGIESRILQATRHGTPPVPAFLDDLDSFFDRAQGMFEDLARLDRNEPLEDHELARDAGSLPLTPTVTDAAATTSHPQQPAEPAEMAGQRALLRVRAELVDEFINAAGEMAITRSRVETEMRQIKASLLDLTENTLRLRQQLREIEIQAETQMQSQLTHLQETQQTFDPLEMDRFTRFQELTRMMAESVNDVTTLQQGLLRNVDNAGVALAAQTRLNRELSQSLMSARMVPFSAIVDRLYRVVRQTAKELDKRVHLDIIGGQVELDRSVLEKMVGPIEHLLRNAVAHGIEYREDRRQAGKPEIGEITISLIQQGNELIIEIADDGAGLNHERIRARALEAGLIRNDELLDEQRLQALVFAAGFSTAEQVSAVAGRGIGMDIVKSEATHLGGHVEMHSQPGQGIRLRIFLPLTLAVTQALLVRSGHQTFALPASMIEQAMELRPEEAARIRTEGETEWLGNHYPWFYLARLLDTTGGLPEPARRHWVLLLKGADRHIALEVDGMIGNQEIVIKNIGPQLARVPGVTGATVLNDGDIALILNPLALLSHRPPDAGIPDTATTEANIPTTAATRPAAVPTVMVVDDSLTVRKIVSRLLLREGYQVVTAKDGLDALEQLADLPVPTAMLVDIEMPRMDGFELTRKVRADARLQAVPIVMITSRIADKHREHARALGVTEYLGKPYDDGVLLGLLRGYVERQPATTAAD